MDGKLRNMVGIYIMNNDKILLLYRIGSKVVQPSWCNIGGHFESFELNDAKACALREVFEEAGVAESDLENLTLKYVTLRLKNNEIRQNYYFFADLLNKDLQLEYCDEGLLEWVESAKFSNGKCHSLQNGFCSIICLSECRIIKFMQVSLQTKR